jgi:hypothetical protein
MAEAVHGWRAHYETLLQLAAETRQEGWPFQFYPPGWAERAGAAVARFREALEASFDCHYPQRATSNLRQIGQAIELAAQQPGSLSGRQVGLVRRMLADSEARWGSLGSAERRQTVASRQNGSEGAAFEHARLALLKRLQALEPKSGVRDLAALLGPTDGGLAIPQPLAQRVRRAWLATPGELVRAGVLASMHDLTIVSGQWTDAAADAGPSEALGDMVSLTWSAFPHAAPLDPLLENWNRLLALSGSDLRLAGSGGATSLHLQLAQTTLGAAAGTLYARYYSLPSKVGDLTHLEELCRQRARQRTAVADPPPGHIRQELRILTSHGLWPLWVEVRPTIDPLSCAHQTASWIQGQLGRPCSRTYQRWQRHKRVAHAFQHLVFYLSLVAPAQLEEFLGRYLTGSPDIASKALAGMLQGLKETPEPAQIVIGWQ